MKLFGHSPSAAAAAIMALEILVVLLLVAIGTAMIGCAHRSAEPHLQFGSLPACHDPLLPGEIPAGEQQNCIPAPPTPKPTSPAR